jgi:thiamine biosynthesis lipoprotein
MGMPVTVDAAGSERVFAWLRWVDATFSTYRADSEISRIDRGELAPGHAHPLVRDVLARCEQLRAATGGYFDARAAGALDPSGLVKGWAVDRAAALLGAGRSCIDAGGDVLVRGSGWRVGIRHPRERQALCAVIEASDLAVATSGAYERGRHIVDPHTGRPPEGVLSVTVIGPDLATADAYATAAYAMGEAGPAWTARLRGYDAMTILAGDELLATPGFVRRCGGRSVAVRLRTCDLNAGAPLFGYHADRQAGEARLGGAFVARRRMHRHRQDSYVT